jgi:hypothetical protein
LNSKGQFSIIAALLVSVILITTVIVTYSIIRNNPIAELPQVQSAIDETNLALKEVLGFTIGYYGSILQVTGNSSYAKTLAINYLQSGLINIANMHPDWGTSFKLSSEILSTNWFTNSSYSKGSMSVQYNLTRLGFSGITYQASADLSVRVGIMTSVNQSKLIVTSGGNPVVNLGIQNFKFYRYSYTNSTFWLISPSAEPVAFANGTYLVNIPSGVDPYSYAIQVTDQRGITVTVWSFNHYVITFTWNSLYSTLKGETIVMELLQNGTMRWLGQKLQTTQTVPIPPLPIRSIHINETTTNGVNHEVPFQIEDWNNNYQVPAGLTGNATVFSNRQMIVFLVNHNVTKATVWWDGRDIANQTSYAYTDRYFKNDNIATNILTNGILKLDLNNWLTSTVGSSSVKADFMRINGQAPTYGSNLAYIIYNGIVRDIVQQEAEWSGGISNCPNVYSHIVITLPANATYYTYQLRLMFVASQQNRIITDMCPIELTASASISPLQTENGTLGGYPIAKSGSGTFYNSSSVWQHHWSQFISGTTGTGIMFTDSANKMLYAFDTGTSRTGALKVDNSTTKTIQLLPVARSSVSFMSAKDVIWYGAVVTFSGTTPIYNSGTRSGLWITVEDPPMLTVTTNNLTSITVTSSPSGTGYVKVDGNAITTPYTFAWVTGSNHTLQAVSPVSGGTSTRYIWKSWSDNGTQTHTYTVPSQSTTVTAYYKSQYLVSFATSPSGAGTTTPSGTNIWENSSSVISISATPSSAYVFSSWTTSGSISIANAYQASTNATINGNGTITATFTLTYASITVTSSPSGAGYVKVDGNAITTPCVVFWTIGSNHTLQAISPVSGPAGTQYVWTGWSDNGAQTHTYTVPSSSATVTANYKTQYYLAVNNAGHGTASGQGWYDPGSNAAFSTSPANVSGGAGIQYLFINWTGAGTGSYSGSASSYSVTISNPITETVNWQTQYFLTVSSAYGTPTSGQGWYNSGATAYAGLNSGNVSGGAGIQYIFFIWSGDASGSNYAQSNGIRMSRPKTATAFWQTQYQVTFNYQVSGGGSNYSAPSVNYTSLGSQHSIAAGPSATVWADLGSMYTYTTQLSGSASNVRWQTNQASGTVSSQGTINPTYYYQYKMTLFYSTNGDGSGYSAPTFTANQFGSPYNQALNTTATGYWFDSGSSWSITNPLTGSGSSERWQTSQSTSGTVSATTIAFVYYHQYKMTLSYSINGGGSPTAPTFTANQYGTSAPQTLTTTATGYWFDSGSSWSTTNPLGGSISTERWQTNAATSGTISSSQTIAYTYYNQYSFTLNYSVSGGGSGYSSPTLTAVQFGSSYTPTLSTTGTQYWLDNGQSWSITNPLSGSGSSQRWQTTQTVSGTVSPSSPTTAGGSLTFTYYDQYSITFQFSVSGGVGGYSAPTVTYTQSGTSGHTVTAVTSGGTAVWVDAGTTYTYTNPLSGSGSSEQWTTSSATGTASASGIVNKIYYNEYAFTLSYSVSGGGSPTAPTLTGTEYGSTYTPTLTGTATVYWLDSASSWSVTNPLSSSGSSQRWQTTQIVTGTVSASQTTAYTYYNQYSFTLSYTVSGGGSPTAPTLTAKQFGSSYTPTLTGAATTYWLDSSQSWSVTNPLGGSGSSERWDSGQTVSGTVSASSPTSAGGTLTFTYYNQYSITFGYGDQDSSTVTSSSQIGSYFKFGSSSGTILAGSSYRSTSPISDWVDAGTAKVSYQTFTAGSGTVRWALSSSPDNRAVSSSTTISELAYYHQYLMTLSYSVTGSSGYSAPSFSANAFGASAPQTLTTTATGYWFDSGSSWTVTNPLAGSSGTERWYTSQAVSGTVSATTIAFVYYHQYQVTFDSSSNIKGDSSATIVTVAGTGYNHAQLPYANWYNSGSSLSYSYASPIGSSSSSTTGYYWSSTSGLGQTLQSNTFTVSASGTVTGTYTTQTFGIDTNCEGFGSVANGRTITTSSMTAQINELIVVVITGNSNFPTVGSITDSFGTHLSYSPKVSYTSISAGQCLYVYYALTGTQTGSFTITISMSTNDNYCVQAFGITGANTATPFDTNTNLPRTASGTTSSKPTVSGVSTSNANDMILAFEGQTSSTAQTAGSSFTAPANLLHNVNSLGNNVEYEIVTSTQSSISVSFGTSVNPWVMAVHAVQRAW